MIIEVFESDSNEASIEIEIENVDVSRVLPFNDNVGERISKEKLISLLDEIRTAEDVNMDEPETYFAEKVSVWLDGNIAPKGAVPFDIPHHEALRLVLESILQEYSTSDDLDILIS